MTDQALRAGGPVDVGPGPGEEPPRKRSRQEDHEVRNSWCSYPQCVAEIVRTPRLSYTSGVSC